MFKILTLTGIYSIILSLYVNPALAQSLLNDQILISADKSVIDGILVVITLAILLSPFYIYINHVKKDSTRKRRLLRKFSIKDQNVILMMASVAKADHEVATSEIKKIRQTIENLTRRKISHLEIEKVIEIASSQFNAHDIQGVITGMSMDHKREILIALFDVIAADGKLRKEEREYSRRLCKGLRINQAFFDAVWVDYFEQNPNKLMVE